MLNPNPLPITLSPRQDIPFIFKSYRELISSLGSIDGLGAGLTVATKEFQKQVSVIQPVSQQLPHALSIAASHSIITSYIDMPNLAPHLSQLLVVATYQQTEFFLANFRDEQRLLERQWRNRSNGEIMLDYILSCFPQGFAANVIRIRRERYQLLEYYRHVRNGFVHASINRSSLTTEYNKVSGLVPYVQQHYGLNAPNPFGSLTFDDHMLFTRLTKYVATDLCRLGKPVLATEIASLLTSNMYIEDLGPIMRRKGDMPKLQKALRGFLKKEFNYDLKLYLEVEKDLLNWLSNVPSKRERKSKKIRAIDAAYISKTSI